MGTSGLRQKFRGRRGASKQLQAEPLATAPAHARTIVRVRGSTTSASLRGPLPRWVPPNFVARHVVQDAVALLHYSALSNEDTNRILHTSRVYLHSCRDFHMHAGLPRLSRKLLL